MKVEKTSRGFEVLLAEVYPPRATDEPLMQVVQQSSAIGDYPDAMDKPGSSYLWVGENHHLNREQVKILADALTRWLETGRLSE